MNLHWELNVLARSVAYGNLSGASTHVGISQPQLSRIIARIEEELGISLLDRSIRRKSAWTPVAFKLAESYSQYSQSLESRLLSIAHNSRLSHLHLGSLEGLASFASKAAYLLVKSGAVLTVDLDVDDLNRLEERFSRGEFQMIFTSRTPGAKKFRNSLTLGYQSLDALGNDQSIPVYSSFEYGPLRMSGKHKKNSALISNSLEVRKQWIAMGAKGVVPSAVQKDPPRKNSHSVSLLGVDNLDPVLWKASVEALSGIFKSNKV